MSSTNVGDAVENTCVVCFKNVTIYSIGECDHPVCYECSTRMRVLCRQNECPICRQDMPKVIFTKNVQPFKNIANNLCLIDKKFKICFESAEIQAAYSKLLEHVCTICPGRPAFRTFNNLKDHMRKEHELHYCDLCVDNLKIFTAERRCYTRQELAQHRRKGDPDDKSHRGHPLCEFCDQRYMDNDELFRHLRRDHLFCHFCDADGYHQYYSSYDYLREHFRMDHFLCEEGSCVDEKFTSAFRTEIDLKAHRASVHGRAMGKAAAKQARTLELEFTLAPRARGERGGAERGGSERGGAERWGAGGRGRGRAARADEEPLGAAGPPLQPPPTLPAPAPRTHCPAEFPSLNGATAISSGPGPASGVTIRSVRQAPLAVTDENFPALGGMDASTATLRLSVNSDRAGDALSIRLNRRAEAPGRIRTTGRPLGLGLDDFPSLSADPAAPSPASQWVALERRGRRGPPGSSTGPTPEPKVVARPKIVQEDFPVLASATTGVEARVKASSVVIPVTPNNTWQHANRSNPPSAVSANCTGTSTPPMTKQEPTKLAAIKVKSKKKKQQQTPPQAKVGVEKTGKELGKRKKRDDVTEVTPPRSGEEEITSKLEGILMGRDGEAAGAERKRSELLIGALHSDAPGPSDVQARACPPGFSRASGSVPPPGFASVAGPPPGFSSVTLNSVARSPAPLSANAITFTSSSGRSYPIVPRAEGGGHAGERATLKTQSESLKEGRAFVEPPDADRRNQALVERIRRVVPMEGFLQFSAFFRQGSLSASAFHSYCRHLLGATAFAEAFPELLVLLPDISKQQELLAAHESEEGHFSVSVETCEHCGQVLAPEDVLHHQSAHKKEKNSISSASDLKTPSVLTALPTVAMESNNGLFGSHR